MALIDSRLKPRIDAVVAGTRPILRRLSNVEERLRPHVRRLDAGLRKYPALARAVDGITSTWHGLVVAFCGLIDPLLERIVPRNCLIGVVTASGDIELRTVQRGTAEERGLLSALSPELHDALRATKWSEIELRLRSDQGLQRVLTFPAASRDFLGPIVQHRLERLTPWRPDQVLYGYRIMDSDASAGHVDVALVATSRGLVDGAARTMREAGFEPTHVGVDHLPLGRVTIDLAATSAHSGVETAHKIVSRVALCVMAMLTIVYVATSSIASGAMADQAAADAKLIKARRLLKTATLANVGDRERALITAKDPDKAVVVLIDRLAAAIPTETFLKELAVTNDTVRLVGSSTNAPALIGDLEGAGLSNVRFSAAVTREKDGRDTFEITAKRGSLAGIQAKGEP